MNIKHQARGGFRQVADDELLVQAETVIAAMDSNANFATPTPDLTAVGAAKDDFSAKLAVARKRSGPEETELKNQSREALAELLKQLAFYVSTTANGNLAVILSSGFQATAYPRRGRVPEQPYAVRLNDGRLSGQLTFTLPKVPGALFYEYRYGTLDEATNEPLWGEPILTTSSRDNLIAGLEEGVRYHVQVRAVNGYGRTEWSDPVSMRVR
ncbi:fibronectin type III domain-containing protein [Parapedobacter sp. 2B3]|uniref:fibronectin type III domain-containing protein n=1 Tax=Parapedobacter sp. 2B3 TaxID=3342381 RepID=UPI0035B626E2